jgi:serine protease Do
MQPFPLRFARRCLLAACVAVVGGCAAWPAGVPDAKAGASAGTVPLPGGFSHALRKVMPSVAGVYGMRARAEADDEPAQTPGQGLSMRGGERAPWSTPDDPVAIGAGFFIDAGGTLVTAAHVVTDAARVLVKTADQRVFVAEVAAQDPELDIAVLQVNGLQSTAATFGRSAASRPGDWVLAVGEPFGLQRSVVAGIVAGRMRHFADDGDGFYIQSDLPLNPGNSGGPLLNSAGEVIGMNLRTVVGPFGTAGVSLSVPIETVRQVAGELRSGHAQKRPRLGGGFEDVSPPAALEAGRAYASGAYVNRVDAGGAAHRMGLRVGDIVVGFNGHPIDDSADLARWLLAWRSLPGTRVVIWRERRYVELIAR